MDCVDEIPGGILLQDRPCARCFSPELLWPQPRMKNE